MYYVEKWSNRGFYDYGVTLDLGWFYTDKLSGEYKKVYDEMRNRTIDYWGEQEFSKYIFKESNRERVTNYFIRNYSGIGEDEKFFGEG